VSRAGRTDAPGPHREVARRCRAVEVRGAPQRSTSQAEGADGRALALDAAVIPKALGAESLRRIHVGRRVENVEASMAVFRDETLQADDRAFFMAAADVVRAAVDEVRFRELVEVMQAAAEDRPVQHVARAVEVLGKREQLSEGEQENVLQHLAAGGDLTRWGVLSAVTRTAEDVDSYDRATELEELGGKLLTYSDSDWRALANA
jgi:hypothetical protein